MPLNFILHVQRWSNNENAYHYRGDEFRPMFGKLGDITCLFPHAAHLALTATATDQSVKMLASSLCYSNPVVIKVNPDRPNIFIEVQTRPPNIRKFEKFDSIVAPLAHELHDKLLDFPSTLVYVESLEALGYFYQYISTTLKSKQYVGEHIPENRIFAQFHKDYTQAMKHHIITELKKESSKIRLVLATVALGMGVDCPNIVRVIHCRPPTTIEKYFQEIGRGGRSGQKCSAVMYFNNSDICASRKGLSGAMVDFCKNSDSCLRHHILRYFGFDEKVFSGPISECCSNCRG